ncbi:MAG: hypothetical protein LBU42_09850, partial [Prevotellaceae bacterium]|nr:hypothetical protein [Prevotellaceae bacterium]
QAVKTWNYTLAPGNRDRMGFGTTTPLGQWFDTEFVPVFNTYNSIASQWLDEATRTPMMTAEFNAAEKAFILVYRKLYSAFLRTNPLVTDKDLVGMGLPEHPSGGYTPAPVATTYPAFSLDTSVIRCLTVHFHDQDSTSKAKPAGQHGAEIRWAVLDVAPVDISELTHSSFDTHTPFTLEFEGHDRGKTVYFALCWENTRGEKGKYSPIASAIIP